MTPVLRSPLVLAVAFAATVLAAPAAHADSIETNPEAEEDCTITDQCPDSGVSCREVVDVCWQRDQCPTSGVECDPGAADADTCRSDAVAAGLELRCEGTSIELYCQPGEKGDDQACHDAARDEGLEERCVDRDYRTIYCDPGEDESGCSVETVGRGAARRGALAVFAAALAATVVRSARRRRRRADAPRS